MVSKYWIKLYHEIIHDPKMGRLPDRVWRRAIELFLIAGETGNDGILPPVEDMAWTLRIDVEQLSADLVELEKVGIVTLDGSALPVVTKFAERQAPVSDAERMQAYRDRQRKSQYYGDETVTYDDPAVTGPVTNRNAEPDTESDTESDTERVRARPPVELKPSNLEALVVFKEKTGRRVPTTEWAEKIENVVGNDDKSLRLWGDIVSAWCGCGWKKTNVKGMLEHYERGEIPGASNGHSSFAPVGTGPPPKPQPAVVNAPTGDPEWMHT